MKNTILLIEDESVLINMYREIFDRHSEFELLTAENKVDGIQAIRKYQPKVILLDLIIPEKPGGMVAYDKRVGFDLLREVKQTPVFGKVRFFIFSNIDTHEDRQTSDELGVQEYLLKADYTPIALIKKLEKYT